MNPIKQLFGQTAVYGMGIVLPRFLNYLLTPVYTGVFDPDVYGIITELYAYVVFLLVVLTYGMETGFFRFATNRSNKNDVYSSVLTSVFSTSFIFILLISLFIKPISSSLGYASHPEYIKWLAYIVAIDAFTSIAFARIRLNNKAVKYALIRIVEVLVNIGLNLFFLIYCPNHDNALVDLVYNPEIGVGYVLISNFIAVIVKLVLLLPEIWQVFKGKIDITLYRQILKYSYPLLIAGLAGTVNEALDRVLLKHLIVPEDMAMFQLGIYGANYKIAVLMTLFVQMFKYAAEPFFFSKSESIDAKPLYADVLRFFVAAGLMIFLGVMLYIDIFKYFINVNYHEGLGIVPVVLLANLVMGIFFNLSIWYKLSNRTKVGAMLVLIGAAITITINVVFIPRYGYIASAWGHLICYSVMVVLSYILSRKHYAIPYDIKRILAYFALVLAFFFIDKQVLSKYEVLGHIAKPLILVSTAVIFFLGERATFNKYKTT